MQKVGLLVRGVSDREDPTLIVFPVAPRGEAQLAEHKRGSKPSSRQILRLLRAATLGRISLSSPVRIAERRRASVLS